MQKVNPDDILNQIGQSVDGVAYGRCWMISFINGICSLLNLSYGEKELREFIQYALDKGIDNKGGYHTDGDDIVLERFKTRGIDNIQTADIPIFSRMFWSNIMRGYPCVVAIWSSKDYKKDRADGVLSFAQYKPYPLTGHAIVLQNLSDGLYFVDSTRKKSKYKIQSKARLQTVKGLFKSKKSVFILYK